MTEIDEDAPLSADEILTFGPAVEAVAWHPIWLQEARAPIAVQAGRPKLGPVFNSDGVGKMVIIRPCMSRGRRLRGLPPVYTPQMLEKNASVFSGWPSFLDHQPPELAAALGKHGRSVNELGGQVLKSHWQRDYVHEDDGQFGYQQGAVIGEAWATPFLRRLVGENPNLLHTSINAWPTSGKPGPVPWRPSVKGMVIEGIRRQPQGSVDYVVRGGAGGRLLVAEGLEDEGEWPEVGEWAADDTRLVVSLAESLYASRPMADLVLPSNPSELQQWLQENAPHLVPALGVQVNEADGDEAAVAALMKKGMSMKEAWAKVRKGSGSSDSGMQESLTRADVEALIEQSQSGTPTVEEFQQSLAESTARMLAERDEQRLLSEHAGRLIESADGIPPKWKQDLRARYAMLPSGAPSTLLIESAETDKDGNELSAAQIIESRVTADLDHVRDLIAEATGKPRVTGEGGAKPDSSDNGAKRTANAFWRQRFAQMGLAESEDKAVEAFGVKVEG